MTGAQDRNEVRQSFPPLYQNRPCAAAATNRVGCVALVSATWLARHLLTSATHAQNWGLPLAIW